MSCQEVVWAREPNIGSGDAIDMLSSMVAAGVYAKGRGGSRVKREQVLAARSCSSPPIAGASSYRASGLVQRNIASFLRRFPETLKADKSRDPLEENWGSHSFTPRVG